MGVAVTINAEAGEEEYDCYIPGHRESGMVGTLHVEEVTTDLHCGLVTAYGKK